MHGGVHDGGGAGGRCTRSMRGQGVWYSHGAWTTHRMFGRGGGGRARGWGGHNWSGVVGLGDVSGESGDDFVMPVY